VSLTGRLKHNDETDVNSKLDELWVKIKNTEEQQTNTLNTEKHVIPFNYLRWVGSAAAVLVVASLGILFFNRSKDADKLASKVTIRKIDVPFGKMAQITLSDGTKVKLNAGSHFSYPSAFSNLQREVNLDGEGFFEVTKNPNKPFLVHTSGFTVKVLGTVFNVKAYNDDKTTETTLLKGKVQVELADDPEKKIILSPHEKLTINNPLVTAKQHQAVNAGIANIKYEVATLPNINNEIYQENAWTENKIIFVNNDFEDVARQMERKYDVRIIFKDEALKKERISGVLRNENLDTALLILKQIIPFQSKVEGNTVYLAYKLK